MPHEELYAFVRFNSVLATDYSVNSFDRFQINKAGRFDHKGHKDICHTINGIKPIYEQQPIAGEKKDV